MKARVRQENSRRKVSYFTMLAIFKNEDDCFSCALTGTHSSGISLISSQLNKIWFGRVKDLWRKDI